MCLAFILSFATVALAAEFPIPEGDVAQLLLQLATNYKTMGSLAIISILIVITVQAVKAYVSDEWKYKRLLTLGASILYSVISGLLVPGSTAISVVITVFLTSGGAVALYEALKGAGIIKSETPIPILAK